MGLRVGIHAKPNPGYTPGPPPPLIFFYSAGAGSHRTGVIIQDTGTLYYTMQQAKDKGCGSKISRGCSQLPGAPLVPTFSP